MYKLSMYQMVCVLCTSFLPLLFWIFARYAAYYGGADGQWAVLGACLIGLYSALIHGMLNKRFPKLTGVEMTVQVFGQWLGRMTAFLYIPGYLLFVSVSLFSFSITVKSLLPNTPRMATVTVLVFVGMVGALYGIETIARVASIVFPVVMLVLSLSYLLVFFRGSWAGVFFHPVSVPRSLLVSAQLLPVFFGLNIYLMLCPYFDHRKHNVLALPFLSVGIVSVYVISVYIISIRVVGYEGLRVLAHPVDFVMQLVQLQGFIVQRFGVGLIFMSTMFQAVFYANHLWALSELSRRTFDSQKTTRKWWVLGYTVLIVVAFRLIPNQQVGDWIVVHLLVPLSWIYLVLEPTFILIVYFVRNKLVQSGDRKPA